jgi:serralysin
MCILCQSMPNATSGSEQDLIHASYVSAASGVPVEASYPGPIPLATVRQMADQLTDGYWQSVGRDWAKFDARPGYTLNADLSALTAEGQALAELALDTWSQTTGILFDTAPLTGSPIHLTFDDDQQGAYCSSDVTGNVVNSAHVNVSTDWLAAYGTSFDSYSFQTYVHEIGHALGLGHQGDYNGSASFSRDAEFQLDSWQSSVMSYFAQTDNRYVDASYAFALGPMMVDLYAIQDLYGAYSRVNAGDTTFGIGSAAGQLMTLIGQDMADGSLFSAYCFTIVDRGGRDTLDLSSDAADQTIDLTPGSMSSVYGLAGNMMIELNTLIETVQAGSGNDSVQGNRAINILYGNDGADVLEGEYGVDSLYGGAGADRLFGGLHDDRIYGGADDDVVVGGSGGDRIWAGDGADTVYGGIGGDIVHGDAGDDLLYGESSSDQLYGEDGNDTVYGGDSADRIYGGAGLNRLEGGGGNDLIYAGTDDNLVYGGDGNDILYGGDGADLYFGGLGSDRISAGGGDDLIQTGDGNDTVYGGVGIDTIVGSDGKQYLKGGDGDDGIYGGAGDDTISGDADDDVLYGDAGNDRVYGGSGNDALFGGDGNNILSSGNGSDSLYGGDGAETLSGGSGDNLVEAQGGDDRIRVGGGTNIVCCGSGNDLVRGGDGSNLIWGEAGDDVLRSGAGNDTIWGGAGADRMIGGDGADMFVYASVEESAVGARDVILDFVSGEDVADLSGLAFNFVGNAAFASAGDLRWQAAGRTSLDLLGDIDGDGVADFEIYFRGLISITAADLGL